MSPAPNAESTDWKRQIEELQDDSRRAFLARDLERLKAAWSDELVVNSPVNRVLDRGQVLDLLQKGVISHASYEEHIETVKRHGDLVIVMGRDVVTDTAASPPVQRRFTNVWRASGPSWRLIARHANVIGAA